jgi:hypothetical protein
MTSCSIFLERVLEGEKGRGKGECGWNGGVGLKMQQRSGGHRNMCEEE